MNPYISLINPTALASSFNITQGILDGQRRNLNTQSLQENALSLSNQIQDINARLDFESAFRAQGSQGSVQDRFLAAGQSLSNPFAAIQATNAGLSVNQAILNQQATRSNLDFFNQLQEEQLRASTRSAPSTSSISNQSTNAPEAVNSRGARTLFSGGR